MWDGFRCIIFFHFRRISFFTVYYNSSICNEKNEFKNFQIMMIKVKIILIVFFGFLILLFPYYIIYLQSDFLSSIVPGWHTDIVSGQLIINLIKFLFLVITFFLYWKLSKIQKEIEFKHFVIHFLLTLPAVLVSKINLYNLLNFHSINPESFIKQIQIIIWINSGVNLLFFSGFIWFIFLYKKLT